MFNDDGLGQAMANATGEEAARGVRALEKRLARIEGLFQALIPKPVPRPNMLDDLVVVEGWENGAGILRGPLARITSLNLQTEQAYLMYPQDDSLSRWVSFEELELCCVKQAWALKRDIPVKP